MVKILWREILNVSQHLMLVGKLYVSQHLASKYLTIKILFLLKKTEKLFLREYGENKKYFLRYKK
jgi:hypothetical protein